MPVKNDEKLAELILYVSEKSATDPKFGATKLNKILFYADFIFYARTGKSITDQPYQRLSEGPAPRRLVPVRDELVTAGHLAVLRRNYYGREQIRTIAVREPNLERFTGAEIGVVDEVILSLLEANAQEASQLSHSFEGWKYAFDRETIPYESVFVLDRDLTEEESSYALGLEPEHAR